ncbi:TetR/AcrR family transcriptional regulator [Streptomyces turgidiscabies]|uniref:Transcriptional regulator, TetR family n=1 Tax=Streptomyces turgidiscabies (strain Car8) TaxID=698760 RepID=L7EW06_STRT8|nr:MULTISPECIES: TetR/AcrR family transcriptional regulator [Streptomyces]ELP62570.1 transcriptional regulator, TetR family [Streptomyces turgidiscabies Car8]MDX3494859.1 TetR/AcrR family transcriptional regulator [Streptomyces turgidiscabies]GAQ71474.1 bacterial regulatory proteins, tetR family [Streptomyces turgidiscabies]
MTSPPSDQTPGLQPGAGLRVDAERNRCRILAAARRLYAAEGLGVSMASVAREAGVGKATLGRRFATRDELVNAVFADRMDAYVDAVTEALADPDPWHGFAGYLHAVCAMQAADRGFADVLTMTFPTAKALEARRAEAYDRLLELITRAKDTGHLREDFTHQDVVILLIANAGVVTATGDAAPDTWRRLVGHMIRSFAAPGAPIPPLPEAPAPAALYRAMVRLSQTRPDTA